MLAGKPAGRVEVLPEPDVLYLPLSSRRFKFTELCVTDAQQVTMGQVLARDPANYSVPLLAPRTGTVRLDATEGHIVLDEIAPPGEGPSQALKDAPHVPEDLDLGSVGMKRYKLLELGAWQFVHDAHTQALPDPFGTPSAVIVSAMNLTPFVARGDVQLHKRLPRLIRGLEHLQGLLEYQPIFLAMPDIRSEFATRVREAIRGYAWVKMVEMPTRYPFGNFAVQARTFGLKHDPASPVWAMRIEGIFAVDRALTLSQPCTVRIASIGGPGAISPVHVKTMPGYPLEMLLKDRQTEGEVRRITGGVLTGSTVSSDCKGLDTECTGLTLLPEHCEREFLSFVRPGISRRSYSRCFVSSLRPKFFESLTTAVRGEKRPCISCGFCEEVCPARIMPHLIHKYLYNDGLEQADEARIDLCVECGLCSFVCPSKIELRQQFIEAKVTIREELHPEAPPAEAPPVEKTPAKEVDA